MEKNNNQGLRIKEKIETICYDDTKNFFSGRAKKYKEKNPYSVTMYQDNNPELVKERNAKEVEKMLPLLELDNTSKVLDIACGIGRWSDAIEEEICEYCGVDFSEELVNIANKRNKYENRSFFVGAANEIEKTLINHKKGKFNRVLLIGILMYLNDEDVEQTLRQIERVCEKDCMICIREPIGIEERLTLKNFFSEELADTYNAIYRTKKELMYFFEKHLLKKGFQIKEEGFLFSEDELNNRKETVQYYYLLER